MFPKSVNVRDKGNSLTKLCSTFSINSLPHTREEENSSRVSAGAEDPKEEKTHSVSCLTTAEPWEVMAPAGPCHKEHCTDALLPSKQELRGRAEAGHSCSKVSGLVKGDKRRWVGRWGHWTFGCPKQRGEYVWNPGLTLHKVALHLL